MSLLGERWPSRRFDARVGSRVARALARAAVPMAVWAALALGACADDPPTERGARAAPDTAAARGADGTTGAPSPPGDPTIDAWLARVDSSVFTRWGACPFECCIYRDWVAEAPVVVRQAPRSDARILKTLPAGARFEADTGFVRITGAQLVVVTQPVEAWRHQPGRRDGGRPDTISPGDTLLVLENLGEGHVMLTHGDDLVSAEQFWATGSWSPYGGPKAEVLGEHAAEWWARVRTADGTDGWIDAYGSELGNVDACGMPS
ncbi:MAG TPA: hypothetical protein VF039_04870 [Longimicrobiales bacterium]